MRRLSGWARLWIVLLVPACALTMWSQIRDEDYGWHRRCDWAGCERYYGFQDENGRPIAAMNDYASGGSEGLLYPLERYENSTQEARQAALDRIDREIARRTRITNEHNARLSSIWVGTPMAFLIAFALLMAAKSAAVWVWRGFRPSKST